MAFASWPTDSRFWTDPLRVGAGTFFRSANAIGSSRLAGIVFPVNDVQPPAAVRVTGSQRGGSPEKLPRRSASGATENVWVSER